MTKKHLKAIADAITDVKNTNERIRLAVRIGKVCETLNSKFDWRKWDKACNVDFKEKGN